MSTHVRRWAWVAGIAAAGLALAGCQGASPVRPAVTPDGVPTPWSVATAVPATAPAVPTGTALPMVTAPPLAPPPPPGAVQGRGDPRHAGRSGSSSSARGSRSGAVSAHSGSAAAG